MSDFAIHLGYEVDTGKPVEIPVAHMVVTGMTQAAGKTTTLEALIARSGLRAVTFITKRGERAFAEGRRMQPFFRERADWQFVSSLIDATMGAKNSFLHSFLMKVCGDTKTLAEVQKNVREAKASARRGLDESVYTQINGYLELVVPQLKLLPPVTRVKIADGLNVMDLSTYSTELQALVIKSVIEHVADHEEGVVIVIPEAWEFLPEGRGSPVKREAEGLIRKGAGLRNFVWLDSQDLAGVWKLATRAAPVYLIGVQREANEIKRTLANIPGGISKPKASDIALLEKGQFFACWGKHVIKTYVQPAWMLASDAIAAAAGRYLPPPEKPRRAIPDSSIPKGVIVHAKTPPPIEEDFFMTATAEQKLDKLIAAVTDLTSVVKGTVRSVVTDSPLVDQDKPIPLGPLQYKPAESLDHEALYQAFKKRLIVDAPALLKVLARTPELEVELKVERITTDTGSCHGMLALLISEGFMNDVTKGSEAWRELGRRFGYKGPSIRAYEQLDTLTKQGFLTKEGKEGFRAVEGMKINIKRV